MSELATLQVWTPRDRRWTAQIVREHGGLLTIGFEFGQAPDVSVGDSIEWSASDTPPTAPRQVGSVTSTYRSAECSHVIVSPCTTAMPATKAPIDRKRVINGRKALRVKPRASERIVGTVSDGIVTLSGRVRDLSIEGIAVYFDGETGETFSVGSTVAISLAIPTMQANLHFTARVARINMLSHGRLYGFQFDISVASFPEHQDVLYVYVNSR